MDITVHNKLVSFIWSIADDCLRDVYVRGKYRDVILPMVVLRRLDVLLEETKEAVMEELTFQREELEFVEWDENGLRQASGYVFYNTSPWTLQRLCDTATNSQQLLLTNFENYLNGYSANVQEIIQKFNLRRQIRHMAAKDVLLDTLEKFTSPTINLTPLEKTAPDGSKLPPLSNLGMGYVFEELIRRFNEENNEEAGEHFTPREVIDLMTHLIFEPIKDNLPPVMTIYDPACGSGGMLTEAQNFITDQTGEIRARGDVYLYGKEINDETYAICKSDMMIKGNDPENIRVGSTLATDEFAGHTFNFMLSNPPYGKSWRTEVKYIKEGKDIIDLRFEVTLKNYQGDPETVPATPRSSDGQLLFLMEMVSKMKPLDQSAQGSRIASVHNGSSLFTGDAGGGESNIRRYIIENDWLEAIIQLPNNLFYNTGITTYIWLLSNHKPSARRGKVQLIDASQAYTKLRKNLGAKNCALGPDHIQEILQVYFNFKPVPPTETTPLASQIFNNSDFGYYKVTIERPQRLMAQLTPDRLAPLRFEATLADPMAWAYEQYGERVYTDLASLKKDLIAWCEAQDLNLTAKKRHTLTASKTWQKGKDLLETGTRLMETMGQEVYHNFNLFQQQVEKALKAHSLKLTSPEKRALYNAISWYHPDAHKVIKKRQTLRGDKLIALLTSLNCTVEQLPDYGYYPGQKQGVYLTYETASNLRDYEHIPLIEPIHAYFLREVKPHLPEAWLALDKTKIGYEISFNKYFYQPQPLRPLETVTAEILALETESEGLILDILGRGTPQQQPRSGPPF